MKKIYFNDRYGLTEAVLSGRKTMTRRIMHYPIDNIAPHKYQPAYEIGDVVAVAQRYQDIPMDYLQKHRTADGTSDWIFESLVRQSHGWTNKQGVIASLMPNRIKITNIKMERLQDITDEDCLREGITTITEGRREIGNAYGWDTKVDALERDSFLTPCAAFASLIDKISGKDT